MEQYPQNKYAGSSSCRETEYLPPREPDSGNDLLPHLVLQPNEFMGDLGTDLWFSEPSGVWNCGKGIAGLASSRLWSSSKCSWRLDPHWPKGRENPWVPLPLTLRGIRRGVIHTLSWPASQPGLGEFQRTHALETQYLRGSKQRGWCDPGRQGRND